MKHLILTALITAAVFSAQAQRYMTRTGRVTFFSSTPVENIEAINNEASCAIDGATGDAVFQLPIRSFKFEKELMQEHFNENYMESSKFPRADFRGKIVNVSSVDFSKDGTYNITVAGKLTMHGVTRDVKAPATITVKGGAINAASKFKVRTADYGIKIPAVVSGKIAQEIEITVNSMLAKK